MIESLRLMVKFLEKHNIRYCLAGGYAVVYYGVNRFTEDLDFFITIDRYELEEVLNMMLKELPVTDFELHHMSLLKVFIKDLRVDIIPYYTQEEKRGLYNAKFRNVYGTRCKMIQLEDLLLLKLSISSTEERHSDDVKYICSMCKDKINVRYLKDGLQVLNMSRFIPYLEGLLKKKLN